MDTLTRFLNYVKMDTESKEENCENTPSSEGQWRLAEVLVKELKELGLEDAHTDEYCTVYGHLPATEGYEESKAFGFIAHMDTVPNGKEVSPEVIENYDGNDVILDNGVVLKKTENPELPSLAGRTLIVTDGRTILGADDKAGIAAIMRMCQIISEENIPHGKICVAFTPDEEVGTGVEKFDLTEFGADFAVTVDGGAENAVECENFNAASAKVEALGVEAHPGSAKGIMVNAAKILAEFISRMPKQEVPEHTEGKEGFYHLLSMEGAVEEASASFILRDFERDGLERRKRVMEKICCLLNEEYGEGAITVSFKDSYYNMYEAVIKYPELLRNVETAIENVGMTPEYLPVRGGTDGCRLSYMGLPCPNIGAGGYGFHGVHEHCTVEGMENAAQVMTEIVKLYAVPLEV